MLLFLKNKNKKIKIIPLISKYKSAIIYLNRKIEVRGKIVKMSKKNSIMNLVVIICMTLSYWVIDIGIRFLSYDSYKFYSYTNIAPSLFSFCWISIFIGVFYLLNKEKRKIFYIISLSIFNLIGLSQYLHFKILERFYSVNDIFLLKEGSEYFGYALLEIDLKILAVIFLSIIFSLITINLSKKYHETYRDKMYFNFVTIFTIICSVSFFACGYIKLGKVETNAYYASSSDRNVYQEFTNPNKNMQVVGMYENIPRGITVYIRNKLTNNTEKETKEIETYLATHNKTTESNEYTGIFKDKNLIVVMMESIDNFLVTPKVMPTLYKLSKEGLNFTNRYSPTFGSGQTINSEFALNTGLYTSLDKSIYDYKNTYKTSLANKFKNEGYEANSIHFNYGYYYGRQEFHQNLGFENHYALLDIEELDHEQYNYEFDSNLIKDPKTSDLIIHDNKFLTFITTYSNHLPYDESNEKCINNHNLIVYGDKELTCINNLAHDTDEMIRLLIEKLEQENKLEDTVLVIVADHYMYGYSKINETKKTSNTYLLQHTPLIIWNSELEHKDIDTLVDTADILPTVLNLFDIKYDPNLYVGEDAFAKNRNNYIYFSEDSYYKDNTLYDRNKNSGEIEIYQQIEETIKFNNNLVSSNYLKTENEKEF